nr:hypothetical protein [Tanacetum cinerariifolium]
MKRYQALKRKPQTEAQARKNMMIYLRNVAGFKMNYFKGITYDDIRPIFKKKFNSNVAFLQKTKEQMEEEDSRAFKRLSETQEEKAAKKQKLGEEVVELKRHLQIVPNDEDDVYTEATPLAHKRVKKLERRNKASKLRRLQKVGTTQRIETSDDTVMDDVSKQGRIIADMDANKDVTLKDVVAVAKDFKMLRLKKAQMFRRGK